MKTLSWILVLAVSLCLPAFGAQSVLVVTNTKAGVTAISKSNYPTVTLKDFVATQFGTNTSNNFIRPGATVTNFNVVSNLTLLSVGTNLVLATDASGNVIGTTVSGGGGTAVSTNSNFLITSNAVPAFNALTTNTSTNAIMVTVMARFARSTPALQDGYVMGIVTETNGAVSFQSSPELTMNGANITNQFQMVLWVPPEAYWYYTNLSTPGTNATLVAGSYYTMQLITGGNGTAGGAGTGTITNVAFMSDWLQISGSPLTGGGGTITGNMPYMPANSNAVVVINDGLIVFSNGVTVLSNQVVAIDSGLTVLSNGVTVVSNGLTTLSNLWVLTQAGLTIVSNGMTVVSNGLTTLSNQVVVINAGLVVVSNGLTTLSNTVVTLTAGQVTFSNAFGVWTNAFTANYQAATNALGVRITSLETATNAMSTAANGVSNRVVSLEAATNGMSTAANTVSNLVNTLKTYTNIYDSMTFNLSNGGSALSVGADALLTIKSKFVVYGWNIVCRPASSTLSLGIKVTNTIPTLAANLVSSGNNPGVTNTLSASNSVPTWSYTNWAVNDTVGYEVTIVTGATNATVEVYGYKIP